MSYGSLIPYAKDGLITTVAARPSLAAIRVSREWPRQDGDERSPDTGAAEAIWLGRDGAQDVDGDADVVVLTGAQMRIDETFRVWLTIQVRQEDGDGIRQDAGTQQAATRRAWTLAYEAVAAVAATPQLGISITGEVTMFQWSGTYATRERTGALTKGGYGSAVELGFDFSGRLTPT